MVELNHPDLDRAFQALADPTRRAIITRLAESRASIGELAEPFRISLAAVSKHVGVLDDAGLVRRRKSGRRVICELAPAHLADAWKWLDYHLRFWTGRLDALERHFGPPAGASSSEGKDQ